MKKIGDVCVCKNSCNDYLCMKFWYEFKENYYTKMTKKQLVKELSLMVVLGCLVSNPEVFKIYKWKYVEGDDK